MQAGLTAGITAADSIFFIQVGIEYLPVIYIAAPFLMLLYIPCVTVLLSRYGVDMVIRLSNRILIVGGIVFFIAFRHFSQADAAPAWLAYAAKLYAYLWYVAVYSTLWNYIDSYFDIQSGKRLFSLFSAGAALGAMLGGALVKLVTSYFSVDVIFLLWSFFAILSYLGIKWIARHDTKVESDEFEESESATFTERLHKAYTTYKTSRFAILLTLVLFSTLTLTSICEFITMGIFSEGKSEEELAGLFGVLTFAANGINLLINLFIFGKLISFLGVRNATLIQPLVYLGIFAYYSFYDSFIAAFFGYLAYQSVLVSIDNNNYNFLFNALPASGKEELRTFIEGFCEPLATAAAGLFLLTYGGQLPTPTLANIALSIVLFMITFVLILRADYVPALVANLRTYWLDLSLPLDKTIQNLPQSETERLVEYSRHTDPKITLTAIRFLWISNQKLALEMFLEFMTVLPKEQRKAANTLLHTILKEDKPEIATQILLWLESDESQSIKQDSLFLETLALYGLVSTNQLSHWRKSPTHIPEELTTLTRLHSWRLKDNTYSLTHLQHLLEGNPEEQLNAIHILGNSKKPDYAYSLIPFIDDGVPKTRLTALNALKTLACPQLASLIPHVTERLKHGAPEELPIILGILENINDVQSIGILLEYSSSFTPAENRLIENLIVKIGKKSIPSIVESLNSSTLNYKARACAAKALSTLSFSQFEIIFGNLVEIELAKGKAFARNYQRFKSIEQNNRGLQLLTRYYGEQTLSVAHFVLHLYYLMGLIPDGELISSSLHSENLRDKANAMETVEQSCGRIISRKIFALIHTVTQTSSGHSTKHAIDANELENILYLIFEKTDELPSAFAAQALWEMQSPPLLNRIKSTLQQTKHTSVNRTFRSIFKRLVTQEKHPDDLNIVEKSHAMAHSELLGGLELPEIDYLLRSLKIEHFDRGEAIIKMDQPCDAAYFLYDGSAVVTYPDKPEKQKSERGDALGHEGFLAGPRHLTAIKAGDEGCRLFAFSKNALNRAIDIFPNVGIHFLSMKVKYTQ